MRNRACLASQTVGRRLAAGHDDMPATFGHFSSDKNPKPKCNNINLRKKENKNFCWKANF